MHTDPTCAMLGALEAGWLLRIETEKKKRKNWDPASPVEPAPARARTNDESISRPFAQTRGSLRFTTLG